MIAASLSPRRLLTLTRPLARASHGIHTLHPNAHRNVLRQLPQNTLKARSSNHLSISSRTTASTPLSALMSFGSRIFTRSNSNQSSSENSDKPPLRKRLLPQTLHENIYTLPNILTFSRLIAAPAIGYLILHDHPHYALGLFFYAGVTDFVDGWIARRWNQRTVVGSVVDPMADKLLMTISTVCLAIQGSMPLYLAVIILGRDVALAISAIYYRYISLPPPKTFTRYWDFSLPSAEVRPTEISKWNTAFQLGLIGWTVAMPALQSWGAGLEVEAALVGFQYFVAATTVWSGASYLYTKDAVRILSQEEAKDKEMENKGIKPGP